jgi:hypothetical protein
MPTKPLVALGALAFAVTIAAPVGAQTAGTPSKPPLQIKDAAGVIDAIRVSALVTAVDQKNRIMTLKGPEGNEFSVLVDPKVKNFAQVKVGDRVVLEYFESVALDFQKGDGIRMMTVLDDSARAKAGQLPGAAALTRVTVVSNIWQVNEKKGTVLVRGPYGHFAEVKLKDPGLLSGVKVGDQMKVTFTQAVAVGVERVK